MENVEVLTHALVKWDGKAMTATHVSPCLDVSMEDVLTLHWVVLATTLHYGLEDFVTSLCVRMAASMDTALLLVYANATLDGLVLTALIVFLSRAAVPLEASAKTHPIQPLKNHMLAIAEVITQDHCVISQNARQLVSVDKDNAPLHIPT